MPSDSWPTKTLSGTALIGWSMPGNKVLVGCIADEDPERDCADRLVDAGSKAIVQMHGGDGHERNCTLEVKR